jgi:hypothetical protein
MRANWLHLPNLRHFTSYVKCALFSFFLDGGKGRHSLNRVLGSLPTSGIKARFLRFIQSLGSISACIKDASPQLRLTCSQLLEPEVES